MSGSFQLFKRSSTRINNRCGQLAKHHEAWSKSECISSLGFITANISKHPAMSLGHLVRRF